MKTKRILLIRHAQTEENKNFQSLIVAIEQLKALKFPRKHIWKSLSLLLNLHKETDLSETGTRQIADLAVILKDASFWKSYRPELIVHRSAFFSLFITAMMFSVQPHGKGQENLLWNS